MNSETRGLQRLLSATIALALAAGTAEVSGQEGFAGGRVVVYGQHVRTYDWTVNVSAPLEVVIEKGKTATIDYQITATRGEPMLIYRSSMWGNACLGVSVNNVPNVTLGGMGLILMWGSDIIRTYPVDISASRVVMPNEIYCHDFYFDDFPLRADDDYVVLPQYYWEDGQPLVLKYTPLIRSYYVNDEVLLEHATAILDDILGDTSGMTGLQFDLSRFGDWPKDLDDSTTLNLQVQVTNQDACNKVYRLTNTAKLTEVDPTKWDRVGELREAVAETQIRLPACDQPPPPPPSNLGCTYGHGYWKTHGPEGCRKGNNMNTWPVDSLTLGTVTYDAAQLCAILNRSPGGKGGANGLVSLAHQLIAVKLNLANGADGSSISNLISQADQAIGSLVIPPVGTGYLPPQSYTSLFEQFNKGSADYDGNGVPDSPPSCE